MIKPRVMNSFYRCMYGIAACLASMQLLCVLFLLLLLVSLSNGVGRVGILRCSSGI